MTHYRLVIGSHLANFYQRKCWWTIWENDLLFYLARLCSLKTVRLNCNSWIDRRFCLFNLRNFRCSFSLSVIFTLNKRIFKEKMKENDKLRSSFWNVRLRPIIIKKNHFINRRCWHLFLQSISFGARFGNCTRARFRSHPKSPKAQQKNIIIRTYLTPVGIPWLFVARSNSKTRNIDKHSLFIRTYHVSMRVFY